MQSEKVVIPWQRIALESPMLMEYTLLSEMMADRNVHPEKAMSIPEMSSSIYVFLRMFLIMLKSILF